MRFYRQFMQGNLSGYTLRKRYFLRIKKAFCRQRCRRLRRDASCCIPFLILQIRKRKVSAALRSPAVYCQGKDGACVLRGLQEMAFLLQGSRAYAEKSRGRGFAAGGGGCADRGAKFGDCGGKSGNWFLLYRGCDGKRGSGESAFGTSKVCVSCLHAGFRVSHQAAEGEEEAGAV